MEIGLRIKEYRKKKKMTQKQLAEKAGVAEITIRQYETGKRTPGSVQLIRVADALGISSFELCDETPPPSYNNGRITVTNEAGVQMDFDPIALQNILAATDRYHPTKATALMSDFNSLNDVGQNEAVKQIHLLTKIPEYRKEETEEK